MKKSQMRFIVFLSTALILIFASCSKDNDELETNKCKDGQCKLLKTANIQDDNGIFTIIYSYNKDHKLIKLSIPADGDSIFVKFNYEEDKLISIDAIGETGSEQIVFVYSKDKLVYFENEYFSEQVTYNDNDIILTDTDNWETTFTIKDDNIEKIVVNRNQPNEIHEEVWILGNKRGVLANIDLPLVIKYLLHDDLESYTHLIGANNCVMQQIKVYNSNTMKLIKEETYTFETIFDSDGFPVLTKDNDGTISTFTYEDY